MPEPNAGSGHAASQGTGKRHSGMVVNRTKRTLRGRGLTCLLMMLSESDCVIVLSISKRAMMQHGVEIDSAPERTAAVALAGVEGRPSEGMEEITSTDLIDFSNSSETRREKRTFCLCMMYFLLSETIGRRPALQTLHANADDAERWAGTSLASEVRTDGCNIADFGHNCPTLSLNRTLRSV